jgi:hypothetical protein
MSDSTTYHIGDQPIAEDLMAKASKKMRAERYV